MISRIRFALTERDMLGRVSAWPASPSTFLLEAAAEYAIGWVTGEISQEGIDTDALKRIIEDNVGVEVFLTPFIDKYPYTERDRETMRVLDNYFMVRLEYITF